MTVTPYPYLEKTTQSFWEIQRETARWMDGCYDLAFLSSHQAKTNVTRD